MPQYIPTAQLWRHITLSGRFLADSRLATANFLLLGRTLWPLHWHPYTYYVCISHAHPNMRPRLQPCLREEQEHGGQASRSWFSPQYIYRFWKILFRLCRDLYIHSIQTDLLHARLLTRLPQCVLFPIHISMHTGLLSVCLVLSSLSSLSNHQGRKVKKVKKER